MTGKTLVLQVFDKDTVKDEGLGEVQVPLSYLDQSKKVEWQYLQKFSGKISSPKKQSVDKQRRSRSRSSSDERKKTKSPAPKKPAPGPQTISYKLDYYQGTLTVTVIECKVKMISSKKIILKTSPLHIL